VALTTLSDDHSAPDGRELLRPVEVARLLGVSTRVLEVWRTFGRGPRFARLTARCVRYRRADVTAWVESRIKSGSAADAGTGL
jgi:predicted DNA-binding transcriptional regulator AlpA